MLFLLLSNFNYLINIQYGMISKDYLYTDIYTNVSDFQIEENSLYIYGDSEEERGGLIADYHLSRTSGVNFMCLRLDDEDYDIAFDLSGNAYNLRNVNDICTLINNLSEPELIYLDVTVLPERIIAPIMQYAYAGNIEVRIIYVEPHTYKVGEFEKVGIYHNSASEINGIAPLPGFIRINSDDNSDISSKLVVFVGFEGGRFVHIYEQYDISGDNILPIIGVPGYRIEYPFLTLWGNRQVINSSGAWRNIKYCIANSIVDAYCCLNSIMKIEPNVMIKLVPIGTKPHTVAALAFALTHPSQIEIIYDNPKYFQRKTCGVGSIIETKLNRLMAGETVNG